MKKIIASFFFNVLSERKYLALRYLFKHKKLPNMNNPETFSEMLLVSKMNEITDFHTVCADKYGVRRVISKTIGDKYLIPLLGRYTSSEDFIIDFESLPNQFALKAAHGSGWNEIVFNKQDVNVNDLKGNIDSWLSDNYFNYGYEKQYKNIEPSIVVEELLTCSDGKVPSDYKFYCFGRSGKGKIIIQVDVDRFGNHERVFYDENWNVSPISILSSKSVLSKQPLDKPECLNEMLNVVRKLSENFNFSRIDLYEVNGSVYFGEITFHPESGYGMYISPASAEFELAKLL